MYANKFAACLMVDDEVVREVRKDDTDFVYLPFGTDYQIRLKNLDHRRAVVSISIDGDDVLDGSRLVVEGNSTTDLKGFLDSKTNKARNAFRFIEKTERVSKHRGDRVDDGLVRIEVQFEEDLPQVEQIIKYVPCPPYQPWDPWWPRWPYRPSIWYGSGFTSCGCGGGGAQNSNVNLTHQTFQWSGDADINNTECSVNINPTMDSDDAENVDLTNIPETTNTFITGEGVTVTGPVINQAFSTTHLRKLAAEKTVIVFKLQGKTSNSKPVKKPLLVKSKIICPMCGEKCKSGTKFCGECGTCLL